MHSPGLSCALNWYQNNRGADYPQHYSPCSPTGPLFNTPSPALQVPYSSPVPWFHPAALRMTIQDVYPLSIFTQTRSPVEPTLHPFTRSATAVMTTDEATAIIGDQLKSSEIVESKEPQNCVDTVQSQRTADESKIPSTPYKETPASSNESGNHSVVKMPNALPDTSIKKTPQPNATTTKKAPKFEITSVQELATDDGDESGDEADDSVLESGDNQSPTQGNGAPTFKEERRVSTGVDPAVVQVSHTASTSFQTSRFRVVRLHKPFIGSRGRWSCRDVAEPMAVKPDALISRTSTAPNNVSAEGPHHSRRNSISTPSLSRQESLSVNPIEAIDEPDGRITTLDAALGNAMETGLDDVAETLSNEDDADNGKENDGVIAKKIEQAMDLVKSHLVVAVQEELEVVKNELDELRERNQFLEAENSFLRQKRANEHSKRDIAVQAAAAPAVPTTSSANVIRSNSDMSLDSSYSVSTSDSAISVGTGSDTRTSSPPVIIPSDQKMQGGGGGFPYVLVPMRTQMPGQNSDVGNGAGMYQQGISYVPMPIFTGSGPANSQMHPGMQVDFSFFQQATAPLMQSMGSNLATIPNNLNPEPGGHRMVEASSVSENVPAPSIRKSSEGQQVKSGMPPSDQHQQQQQYANGGTGAHGRHHISAPPPKNASSSGQFPLPTPQQYMAMQQHMMQGFPAMSQFIYHNAGNAGGGGPSLNPGSNGGGGGVFKPAPQMPPGATGSSQPPVPLSNGSIHNHPAQTLAGGVTGVTGAGKTGGGGVSSGATATTTSSNN